MEQKREVTRTAVVSAHVMRGAEMVSSSADQELHSYLGRKGKDGKAAAFEVGRQGRRAALCGMNGSSGGGRRAC